MRDVKPETDLVQPMDVKVDPRRWTTKVNIAMVIATVVIFLTGAAYALYATLHPEKVKQDVHDEVTAPGH